MNTFEQQLYYWTHMLDEAFGKNILTEGKHWPEDYAKTAFNTIKASTLGQQSWYTSEYIQNDIKYIIQEFEPLSHKNSNLGFFMVIIRWFIEYAGSSMQKYQEFIERKLDGIIRNLQVVLQNISSEEKDKLKKISYKDFEQIQKDYDEKIRKSDTIYTGEIKDDYDIIFIKSYEQLHKMFGGDKTGYKGKSEWCHTNGISTYDSWTSNKTKFFFVLAKKGWENITPPPPETTNAYDEYGTSLIAILVSRTGKLLNATLRWNHNIDPSQTILGTSTDRAFLTFKSLSDTVGMDVKNKVLDVLKQEKVYEQYEDIVYKADNMYCAVKDGRLTWLDSNNNEIPVPKKIKGDFIIDTQANSFQHYQLDSLEGCPEEIDGIFQCYGNLDLKGIPKKVKILELGYNELLKDLHEVTCEASKNIFIRYCYNLVSLSGLPNKVVSLIIDHCDSLQTLDGSPKDMLEFRVANCKNLKSLKGAPNKITSIEIDHCNGLQTLEGSPREIIDIFSIIDNDNLKVIKSSTYKAGYFECINNKMLTSLEGSPKEVDDGINISNNSSLSSLVGLPNKINGRFMCDEIPITSLVGAPSYIGKNFDFSGCYKLKSLEGFPEFVGGNVYTPYTVSKMNEMIPNLSERVKGTVQMR